MQSYSPSELVQAKMELEAIQRRHRQFLNDNHLNINESVEFEDSNLLFNEMEKYRQRQAAYQRSIEEKELLELIEHESQNDFKYIDDGDTAEQTSYAAEAESHHGIKELDVESSTVEKNDKTENFSSDVQGVISILDDLDSCLEHSSISGCCSNYVPLKKSGHVSDIAKNSSVNYALFTPPSRPNFSAAIDSVLVTKKRLSESSGKGEPDDSLLKLEKQRSDGSGDKVSKSLHYDNCGPDAGFVKFSQVSDSKGHKVFLPKPFDNHSTCPPHFVSRCNKKPTDSYLASLNRSGHLSPFIKSIAGRYELFSAPKPHFRQYDLDITEPPEPDSSDSESDLSYGLIMLQHFPDVKLQTEIKEVKQKVEDADTAVNTESDVNQMLNNYVYEVITGGKCKSERKNNVGLTESDIELRSVRDIDSSMAVCFDENSVITSKEDFGDESLCLSQDESRSILISVYEDAQDMPMKSDEDDKASFASGIKIAKTQSRKSLSDMASGLITMCETYDKLGDSGVVYADVKGSHQEEIQFHELKAAQRLKREAKSRTPLKTYKQLGDLSWKTDLKLQDSGNLRRHSSYCRISFTDNASSFWFCKDFGVSPMSKTRVRSPKRTSFDLKTENGKETHRNVVSTTNLCPDFNKEHCSPAKKRRRSDSSIKNFKEEPCIGSKISSNTNSNALFESFSEDGNVQNFFGKESVAEICNCSFLKEQRVSFAKLRRKSQSPYSSSDTYANKLDCNTDKTSFNKRSDKLTFSGSAYSDLYFIDDCSEKRKKRAFLGKLRSKGKLIEAPVKLLSYKKIEDLDSCISGGESLLFHTDVEAHKDTVSQRPELVIRYDGMFRLHPESLSCTMHSDHKNPPVEIRDTSPNIYELEDGNSVEVFFRKDTEALETIYSASDTNHSKQTHSDPVFRSPEIKDLELGLQENKDADFEAMLQGRNTLYSVISAAVQACSDIVTESLQTTDELITSSSQSSKEDLYVSTPDPELLVKDLQGLNLSETPQYASSGLVDKEMKSVLNEALDSLDNILSESFSFSTESPLKTDMVEECEETDCGHDVVGIQDDSVNISKDSALQVIGTKCIIHEEDSYNHMKVIMPELADETIEVKDDSVLNIEGKRCVLHLEDQVQGSPCPRVTITQITSNFGNYDEVHEIDEVSEPSENRCCGDTRVENSTTNMERFQQKVYRVRSFEKQPSYFCIQYSPSTDDCKHNQAKELEDSTEEVEVAIDTHLVSEGCSRYNEFSQRVTLEDISYFEDLNYSRGSETDDEENMMKSSGFIKSEDSSIEEALVHYLKEENMTDKELSEIRYIDEDGEYFDDRSNCSDNFESNNDEEESVNNVQDTPGEGPLDVTRGSSLAQDIPAESETLALGNSFWFES